MKIPMTFFLFAGLILLLFPFAGLQLIVQMILTAMLYLDALQNTKICINGSGMRSYDDIHIKAACLSFSFLFIEIWKLGAAGAVSFLTDQPFYDVLYGVFDTSFQGYVVVIIGSLIGAVFIRAVNKNAGNEETEGSRFRREDFI